MRGGRAQKVVVKRTDALSAYLISLPPTYFFARLPLAKSRRSWFAWSRLDKKISKANLKRHCQLIQQVDGWVFNFRSRPPRCARSTAASADKP